MKRTLYLFISLCLRAGCGRQEPPGEDPVRNVRAMKVGAVAELTSRSFPGRASAAQEVDMTFRVTGPLVALPVNVGDDLEAGALVARIDPRDFEVALRNAEGGLQQAQATANRAKLDLERMAGLQERSPGAISETDVDQAREAVDIAEADIATFQASVEAAEDALKYTQLRVPYAGTIVAIYVENFQNVRAQQMVVRLLDKTKIEFEVGIPETLISMAPYVENIYVTFDAFPDIKVPANLKEIGREASATTRSFPVTVLMEQPEGAMSLAGMMIKNAIVLLDECNVQLEEGKGRYDAIGYAALSRLRPVSLAAATTVLGVVPLLQDVFWLGLSVTVMAGLSFGTILTMILVPVLYSTVYKLRAGKA